MSIEKALNEYLFYEFGLDGENEENKISEKWPFEFRFIGEIEINDRIYVYEFSDSNEEFFVLHGKRLSYYSKNGMDIKDLFLQEIGSQWIGEQNSIDLNTTKIGDDKVPPVNERRLNIEKLAEGINDTVFKPKILEGIFLRSRNEYIALVEIHTGKRFVVGSNINPESIKLQNIPAWRCLSWVIGKIISQDHLL